LTKYLISSPPLQIIPEQRAKDERVRELIAFINDAYGFLGDAEPLVRIKDRLAIAEQLARETSQCANFIKAYLEKRFGELSMPSSFGTFTDTTL
jgi:hypothetical protein